MGRFLDRVRGEEVILRRRHRRQRPFPGDSRAAGFARASALADRGEGKVRLWRCAGCRLLGHLFQEPETKKAVELAELDVEGLARREEIRTARSKVFSLFAARLGWREDDVEFMMAQDSTWLPHF